MLNHIVISGRLIRDPDLRSTQNGTAVASFCLAVDRDFKSQDGSRDADLINCIAWRKTAEFVDQYFIKGQQAIVSGRLQVRTYTDRDGAKRTATEVVAESVYFAGPKPKESTAPVEGGQFEDAEDDGDLPF